MKDYKFADAQFMMAREKMLVLKAWERFLRLGLQRKHFTKRLYNHLYLNCQFIAHFDENGFHTTYFGVNAANTMRFLKMFDPRGDGLSAEHHLDEWLKGKHGDLNRAMREVAGPYLKRLLERVQASERARDLAEARRLLVKHAVKTEGLIPEWGSGSD